MPRRRARAGLIPRAASRCRANAAATAQPAMPIASATPQRPGSPGGSSVLAPRRDGDHGQEPCRDRDDRRRDQPGADRHQPGDAGDADERHQHRAARAGQEEHDDRRHGRSRCQRRLPRAAGADEPDQRGHRHRHQIAEPVPVADREADPLGGERQLRGEIGVGAEPEEPGAERDQSDSDAAERDPGQPGRPAPAPRGEADQQDRPQVQEHPADSREGRSIVRCPAGRERRQRRPAPPAPRRPAPG